MFVAKKYKVHGLNTVNGPHTQGRANKTKFYETYEKARKVAETCATNRVNAENNNAFVIYKAIEVIALTEPVKPPTTVHQVD